MLKGLKEDHRNLAKGYIETLQLNDPKRRCSIIEGYNLRVTETFLGCKIWSLECYEVSFISGIVGIEVKHHN